MTPANYQFCGMEIVTSGAVAPDELVLHGSRNSVRWTPDGGVEELNEYQRSRITAAVQGER